MVPRIEKYVPLSANITCFLPLHKGSLYCSIDLMSIQDNHMADVNWRKGRAIRTNRVFGSRFPCEFQRNRRCGFRSEKRSRGG